MDNIISGSNSLILDGRTLRDQLTRTGEHPEILRKLNDLVDLSYLDSPQAEKLKNLIAKVNSK
ncbi:hypothetical protein [Pseudomonas izuensis]|uniref:hypothetical protein n=1 Tax=Pseudomonas izuensis TaxID=2684212 RepID=UPI00135897FE|nr:hypothetical protein [Pseudomonas izuensis]